MKLGINGGDEIYWTGEYNEADFTSPTSFADDSWHQLVVTYDGGARTAAGYLDGTLLGSHVLGSGWDTTLDTPGLAATTYSYDAAGRVASRTDADGRTTSYGHDADGNQISLTDAMGRATTSAFDADDRLVSTSYSDQATPAVAYAYDAAGRRTSMTDGTGTSTYVYDPAGQLTSVTNGAGATVGYGYDALGRVDSTAYPDGNTATKAFDADGRLASVTDWNNNTTSFGYDGDGNLTSTTYPNGVIQTTTVDRTDQPTGIDVTGPGGAALASFGYAYTPGGLVASTTDSLAPNGGHSYGYNGDDQLVAQDANQNAYGHDGAANLTATDTGDALAYDGAGQLLSDQPPAGAPAAAYSYDADGERVGATTGTGDDAAATTYSYDQAGRLVGYADTATGADVAYSYDGDGLRASTTTAAGGATAEYVWDQATGSLPLLLSDGADDYDYLYGPGGQPIEQISQTDGATTWLVADRLGSIRLATDNNGNVVGTSTFDAYGKPLSTDEPASPFGYTGQYTDPTGLVYLRARYYDPATGGFLTQDPAYNQTHAWHAYAAGNPLTNTDPSGLLACGTYGLAFAGSSSTDCSPDLDAPVLGCGNGARSPAAQGCTYRTQARNRPTLTRVIARSRADLAAAVRDSGTCGAKGAQHGRDTLRTTLGWLNQAVAAGAAPFTPGQVNDISHFEAYITSVFINGNGDDHGKTPRFSSQLFGAALFAGAADTALISYNQNRYVDPQDYEGTAMGPDWALLESSGAWQDAAQAYNDYLASQPTRPKYHATWWNPGTWTAKDWLEVGVGAVAVGVGVAGIGWGILAGVGGGSDFVAALGLATSESSISAIGVGGIIVGGGLAGVGAITTVTSGLILHSQHGSPR